MIPHSIRLRHPWETIPSEAGRATFRRTFNSPTGLDAWQRVSLEIDRVIVSAEVSLNDVALGRLSPGELFVADITDVLKPGNELLVAGDLPTPVVSPPPSNSVYIVEPDEPLGSPIGDVRLVIRMVHPAG